MKTPSQINTEIIVKQAALESDWLNESIKRDLKIQIDTLRWVMGELENE